MHVLDLTAIRPRQTVGLFCRTANFAAPRCAATRDFSRGDAPLPLAKAQHLDPTLSPKRILALDGGGIRGILTLQFLQAVETEIKARFGDKTRLCDYFDLIGGASTGSIIAGGSPAG
jgi:hypothetical protein